MMNITESQLEQLLHTEIPLSNAMGIQVKECKLDRLVLFAPLEPNINHKCTAFGGSLYSIAVLCGWGFIYAQLADKKISAHIVIHKSDILYNAPVDNDITAICLAPSDSAINLFFKTLQRKKRARLKLLVKIFQNNRDAVVLHGDYVVHY